MDKNFAVGQSNEIVYDGKVYDVHNRYDFAEFLIRNDRRVSLTFTPNPEHGDERDVPLVLLFDKVDYLEVSPGFGARPVHDLVEFGYKNPGDRDDAWLMTEDQAGPNDHLFIRFDFGVLRIHAEQARVVARNLSAVPLHDQAQ